MFLRSKSIAALTGASLLFLAACDAGDYTYSEQDAAIAANAPALNFQQEVATLTRSCLAALEASATAMPDLSARGYVATYKNTYEKRGPKVALLNKTSRSAVRLRYSPGGNSNTCNIDVEGLGPDTTQRGSTPAEQAVRDAAFGAARAAGWRSETKPRKIGGESQLLVKGDVTLSVSANVKYFAGARSTQFLFARRK